MSEDAAAAGRNRWWIALLVCALFLVAFWIRSQVAVRGKSSTYDEPMHSIGAWVHLHYGDFRINYEDPPLWHYWAALPNGKEAIKADFESPNWKLMADRWEHEWYWSTNMLYRTPGNDGEAFVQRSRSMMIVIGVLLGAAIAWWGWQVGGLTAAVGAAFLFSFDPNFRAHAALVKNDVPVALCMTLLAIGLWRLGRRLTYLNLAGVCVACGAAMSTKFTGVVLAPACVVILLGLRALVPMDWPVLKWTLAKWWQRWLAAAAVALLAGLTSYVIVWAAYGFRFVGIPNGPRMNTQYILDEARKFQIQSKFVNIPPEKLRDREFVQKTNEQIQHMLDTWKPDKSLRAAQWMLDHKLFPEAWLHGLMFVQARSYIRGSFLDGQTSPIGFRRYFPLAMLYKTPLSTLIAVGLAAVIGVVILAVRLLRRKDIPSEADTPLDAWNCAWLFGCLLIPPSLFMLMSIQSNLNIGLRHVLPVYPPVFVCVGLAISALVRSWKWIGIGVGVALAAGLFAESAAIHPDYITFFNVAAGGQRGGLKHLGDSNLDWGQDLPLLAAWQKKNPDVPLYLSYFGMVDPAFYHIRYLNLPGGYELNATQMTPGTEGVVVALSATKLQCVYMPEQLKPLYKQFEQFEPTEVLGGTIYIYDFRTQLKPAKK